MATRRNDKIGPLKIVGAVSKVAGTLVGSAVVAGKRIVRNVTSPKRGSSKLGEKFTKAPAKGKKRAAPKKKTKSQKAKKTGEIAKPKAASSRQKPGTSAKKSVQTSAGGKKKVTRRAETKGQKAKQNRQVVKRKGASPPRKGRTSKQAQAVKEQEPQPEVAQVESYSNEPRQASASADSVP